MRWLTWARTFHRYFRVLRAAQWTKYPPHKTPRILPSPRSPTGKKCNCLPARRQGKSRRIRAATSRRNSAVWGPLYHVANSLSYEASFFFSFRESGFVSCFPFLFISFMLNDGHFKYLFGNLTRLPPWNHKSVVSCHLRSFRVCKGTRCPGPALSHPPPLPQRWQGHPCH